MFKLKNRVKKLSLLGLFSLLTISATGLAAYAGTWKTPIPSKFKSLNSLEYHLRWDNERFKSHYAWHFIPSAKAELPPQYQNAFSLKITPNHKKKTLHLEYHKQMVADDKTYRYGSLTSSTENYNQLANYLSQPIECTNSVERGMVGPSPEYLALNYKKSTVWLFASTSERGYAGPGKENREKAKRAYLCNTDFSEWLNQQIKSIPLKSK